MAYNWRRVHGLRGALRPVLAGCAVLIVGVLLPAPALAVEGKPPMIESMGTGIGGEVTVSAHINPEGLETTYEIKLECGTGEPVPCDSDTERAQRRAPRRRRRSPRSQPHADRPPARHLLVWSSREQFRRRSVSEQRPTHYPHASTRCIPRRNRPRQTVLIGNSAVGQRTGQLRVRPNG